MSLRIRAFGVASAAMLAWAALHAWRLPHGSSPERGTAGAPITLALVGDLVVDGSTLAASRGGSADAAIAALTDASIAIGNLEMNYAPAGARVDAGVWATAPATDAQALLRLGLDAVSCANNHGSDNGADTVAATAAALDAVGIAHAGCGTDLAAAREPSVIERGGRKIAFLAATISAAGPSRATAARPGILGRSGVRAVRYRADVTVDAQTFALLQRAAPAAGDDEMALFGSRIQKGPQTRVAFAADEDDLRLLVDDVRRARSSADVVVLSLHAHEPGNGRLEPAAFVRDVARRAVSAGADIVMGHGPHQLRGIERYGRGIILYSLGNFVFHYDELRPATVDAYNGGIDLYDVAIGAADTTESRALPGYDEAAWWQGLLAVAQVTDAGVTSVQLRAIDLGRDARGRRGTPRQATAQMGMSILSRLAALSTPFGTHLSIDGGVAWIASEDGDR